MIIRSVEIIIVDNEGDENDTCIKFSDNKWWIEGPVFPRYMRLISLISEFMAGEKAHATGKGNK